MFLFTFEQSLLLNPLNHSMKRFNQNVHTGPVGHGIDDRDMTVTIL